MDPSRSALWRGAHDDAQRRDVRVRFHHPGLKIGRQPFYQEFLRPHGLRWCAGVKVGDGDGGWALALQRTIEQGPFEPGQLERLAALSRRLAGAANWPPHSASPAWRARCRR